MSKRLLFACLALGMAAAAPAQPPEGPRPEPPEVTAPHPKTPAPLRWMMRPLRRGMLIRLPVVDTDPNRGVTYGIMPIWVVQESRSSRIAHIHAPSLTYNQNFLWKPTYRYYHYPRDDAALILRGSLSKFEKELMGHYEDRSALGTDVDVTLRFQYEVDAGARFFGLGPDTPQDAETNYKEDYYRVLLSAAKPIVTDSHWRVSASGHFLAEEVSDGPLTGVSGFTSSFPGFAPAHRKQSNEMRLGLGYDSRDHAVTTSEGAFLQTYAERSVRGFASSYDYGRYGVDGRYFHKWENRDQVSAVQFKYEQLLGTAPFWLQPRLGGKYNLRAYGAGRYIDRGMMVATLEQRLTIFKARMAGVSTDIEVAPFAGVGTVFDTPGRLARRYARPVVGSAVRAVARPQVVGSIDIGVGQEGVAIFMDINYSF